MTIPKPSGGERALGIPTVVDRVVQQAIAQIMTPIFDPEFSESSYGFRPGRSAHGALKQVRSDLKAGYRIAVDLDLAKFFDNVDPPYHSKYNPVERCWGILEKHWNGAKLTDSQTMLEWAKSMTWKGVHPVVELSRTVYEKGVTVAKDAMQAVESRLERNPLLPKWDILIRPA